MYVYVYVSCVLRVSVVYVLRVCVDVRFVFWCCGVLCCVVMSVGGAGVGAQCVVCVVCCVARLGTRKLPCVSLKTVSMCTFKTLPCEPAKRAHVEHMRAFCQYTRKHFASTERRRFEPTHGEEGR